MANKNRKVKNALNVPKSITNNIPYVRCVEEGGIFESEPGTYSKAYFINSVESENVKDFNNGLVTQKFGELLNSLPSTMNLQFVIHNRLISQEAFLKKILVVPNKEEAVNKWIGRYNDTLAENSDIGHNNIKKNKYFIISTKASSPDDALTRFDAVDKEIKQRFGAIYGIKAETLSAVGRLKVMYSMFNPLKDEFGKKADLHGDGTFKLSDMKKLRLNTKDVIAPATWDHKQRDYMILDDNVFARVFFISNLPPKLDPNLISDITSVGSNMVFSAFYEPVDAEYGFKVATERVSENIVIKETMKRDTIKDRRDRARQQTETMIKENEQAYFDVAALETLKGSVARGEKAMLCSFIVVIYAEDLEMLNRDTKLLSISTSKFGCQVKPLDLQQLQGFQSALPLGCVKVDVKRLLPIQKLAMIPPLNIQEILQKDGQFFGLNAINDNLVLLNRKNFPCMSGFISGTEHIGKTFQVKREAFNASISSNDKVVIVTTSDEYDNFIRELGGMIVTSCRMNPFSMVEHYGLVNPDRYSKSLMLEAMLDAVSRSNETPDALVIDSTGQSDSEDARRLSIKDEVTRLLESGADVQNPGEVLKLAHDNPEDYPMLSRHERDVAEICMKDNEIEGKSRIQLIKVHSLTEKIIVLDYLWNRSIQDKMKNTSAWIFIDAVDDFLSSEQCSNFLLDYVEKMDAIKNVLTLVIQSSVKLFTDNATTFRMEDLIKSVGYCKLLNQAAIERRRYKEILNISNTLVNAITAAELGKGIILTAASNIVFDDNFYSEDEAKDTLYSLFKV